MSDLFFGNGIALGPENTNLLTTETRRSRILKYHLSVPQEGKSEIFIDALPAMPDNLFLPHKTPFGFA